MVLRPAPEFVRTADGTPLKLKLRQAERKNNLAAFLLLLPVLAFLLVFFLFPLWSMLKQSVDNREVMDVLPRTVTALGEWGGKNLPGEAAYGALALDLRRAHEENLTSRVATRLNYEISGYRSLMLSTARRLQRVEAGPWKAALLAIDERWGEREYWAAIKRNSRPFTDHYFLNAVDHTRDVEGEIVPKSEDQRIYLPVLLRTFWISAQVTLICLVLGYPVAYLLATQPARVANFLMIFVLLPFWTSLLVRTVAWVVLLQRQGLLNDLLLWLGLTAERVTLVFNRPGLLIAMTHVLLPFMILPIYSTMTGIDPQYMRAAKSLGASPARAFLTVYVPLTVKGVGAGILLVYIIAIGYYITPELVGGPHDQMITHYIAMYTSELLNWGQAAALAVLLLVAVFVLYSVYALFFRLQRI
jgi:putative spermidine/putrescine transport system permease protein